MAPGGVDAPKSENYFKRDGKSSVLIKFHDHMLNRFDCYLDGIICRINPLLEGVQSLLVAPDMKTIGEVGKLATNLYSV